MECPPDLLYISRIVSLVEVKGQTMELLYVELTEAHEDGGFGAVAHRVVTVFVSGGLCVSIRIAVWVGVLMPGDIDRSGGQIRLSILVGHGGRGEKQQTCRRAITLFYRVVVIDRSSGSRGLDNHEDGSMRAA